jgi:hypothetical protein
MNVPTAIAVVLDAHAGDLENTAACMFDYLEDECAISSPTIIEAMEVILDACQIVETHDYLTLCDLLKRHNVPLANAFADTAELCRTCNCDLEVCVCTAETDPNAYLIGDL